MVWRGVKFSDNADFFVWKDEKSWRGEAAPSLQPSPRGERDLAGRLYFTAPFAAVRPTITVAIRSGCMRRWKASRIWGRVTASMRAM